MKAQLTKSRLTPLVTGAITSVALLAAGSVFAGGAGGCIYSGQLAELENAQPLVPADEDGTRIDPKWLLELEQQEVSDATPAPVVHN